MSATITPVAWLFLILIFVGWLYLRPLQDDDDPPRDPDREEDEP
jgi:hypothetical protein